MQPQADNTTDTASDLRQLQAASRHRPLIPVLVGFAAGIALDSATEPPLGLWTALGLSACALAVWGVRRGLHGWGHWLLAVLVMVPAGGISYGARFRQKPAWHLQRVLPRDGALLHVQGSVAYEPEWHYRDSTFAGEGEHGGRFWLIRVDARALSRDGADWRRTAGGIAVFGNGLTPNVEVGDRVQFLARLSPNRGPTNPGERDRALGYARAGSYATASVSSAASVRLIERAAWYRSVPVAVGRLRTSISMPLQRALRTADVDGAGLISALLFGRRGELTQEESDLFVESGTLHLLAISGLHVGIFCLLVGQILVFFGVEVRWRLWTTIVLVWLYVLFTGAHASAARAGWLLTFMLGAPLLKRRGDHLSALAGAALTMLVLWPEQLFYAGLQLTFVSVWGITCIYTQWHEILWPWSGLVERLRSPAEERWFGMVSAWVRSYVLLSCVVWAVTAPLIAYHFNVVCWATPVLNVVVWIWLLPLLLTCFAIALLQPFGGAVAQFMISTARMWGKTIVLALREMRGMPGWGGYVRSPPLWWVVLFYVLLCLWVFRWRLRGGRRSFVGVVAILGVGHLLHGFVGARPEGFELTIADVGHGQAVVARTRAGQTVLFDAGSSRTSAQQAVAEMLWHKRVRRVDALTISSSDADHCGFLPFLQRCFPIGLVVVRPPLLMVSPMPSVRGYLEDHPVPTRTVIQGSSLTVGGLACRVLHPDGRFLDRERSSQNDSSMVLHCTCEGLSFLLPGDIENAALATLSDRQGSDLRAQLLLLPHHGHYHEGLKRFVGLVDPAVAVVSGRVGDCDARTRRILAERGVPLFTTAEDGAVTLRLDGGQARVEGWASGRRVGFALDPRAPSEGGGYD